MAYTDYTNDYTDSLYRDRMTEGQNRADRLTRAWNAYRGIWPDLVRQEPGVNDNVKMNPARFIVNTGVHYLFGKPFTIQGDFDNVNPPQWAKDVDKLLLVNKQMKTFQKLAINGGVTGHVFVKILPTGAGPKKDMPRWVVVDPGSVDVVTDPQDVEVVLSYTLTSVSLVPLFAGAPPTKTMIHQQVIEYKENGTADFDGPCWLITEQERAQDQNAFRVISRDTWPYAWGPIVDCQNLPVPNDFWGLPDLEMDVLDVCTQLQYIATNCAKIVRIYGAPRVVAKGITSDQVDEIDVSPENIITLPDPDATLEVLGLKADLSASLETQKMVYEALREMTQVPEIATGKTEHATRASSGTQMAMMFAPIIVKTESKQLTYGGDLILELVRRSLVLMDSQLPESIDDPWELMDMRIEWPEVMPGASFLERQTLTVDQQLGASMDTVLMKLGYDPQVEKTNIIKWYKMLFAQVPELGDMSLLASALVPKPGAPMPPEKPSGVNPTGSLGGQNSAGSPKTGAATTTNAPPSA